QPAELARVPEGLEVEQDDVGAFVLLPPLEQVVRGDVGLVPDGDERREAEISLGRLLEQSETEGARLRRHGDSPGRECPWREGRVQPDRRRCDAEAVRPDETRAVR